MLLPCRAAKFASHIGIISTPLENAETNYFGERGECGKVKEGGEGECGRGHKPHDPSKNIVTDEAREPASTWKDSED
jgi:hypothetical protein